jgi:hypothetical protein
VVQPLKWHSASIAGGRKAQTEKKPMPHEREVLLVFIPQFGLSALFVFSTMTRLAFVTQRMFSLFETAVMSLKESPSTVSS